MFEILWVALALYGLSMLVTTYDGAWGLFRRLRQVKPLRGVLDCPVCFATWLAIVMCLFIHPMSVIAGFGLFLLVVRNE